MWEEMNCEQVRQWQHWGSGCYKYHCKKGRLHIEVLNQTFTCFYPQQEIPVSLISQNWLHSGSLVCPPCEEICGAEFRKYGQKCRPGQAPPRTYVYTYDGIGALCGCYKSDCNQILLMASILVTAVYYNFVQRLWYDTQFLYFVHTHCFGNGTWIWKKKRNYLCWIVDLRQCAWFQFD